MSTATQQTALPLSALVDPTLPDRTFARLHAATYRDDFDRLASLVLAQHDDERHAGAARLCDRAACQLAAGAPLVAR